MQVPLHSFPRNLELKPDEVFGDLFGYPVGYHRVLELCNCSVLLDTTGENITYLSTTIFSNQLNCSWPVCPVFSVAHFLSLFFNNDRFTSLPVFITQFAFFLWFIHICQYVHVLLVFPNNCCQGTSCPSMYEYITSSQLNVLLSKNYIPFHSIPFLCSSVSHF